MNRQMKWMLALLLFAGWLSLPKAHAQMVEYVDTTGIDTLLVDGSTTGLIEVSKSYYSTLIIKNIIPDNIKNVTVEVISSSKTEISAKKIGIDGLDIALPIKEMEDQYWQIFIKKGREVFVTRRLKLR